MWSGGSGSEETLCPVQWLLLLFEGVPYGLVLKAEIYVNFGDGLDVGPVFVSPEKDVLLL